MADCLEVGCCCELHTDSRPSLNMSSIVILISISEPLVVVVGLRVGLDRWVSYVLDQPARNPPSNSFPDFFATTSTFTKPSSISLCRLELLIAIGQRHNQLARHRDTQDSYYLFGCTTAQFGFRQDFVHSTGSLEALLTMFICF